MVPWWKCDIATVGVAFEPLSTRSRTRGRMQEGHCLCARRSVNTFGLKWCWPARFGVWLRDHGQQVATNIFHHVWASLSKPVERSGVYFASPTDMFITCLKNWHAQWPARRNKWFGSGGPLPCLSMFKQTCWELWSVLHMADMILFDRLTCTMTCQVKQMIGIVSCARVAWQRQKCSQQAGPLFPIVVLADSRNRTMGDKWGIDGDIVGYQWKMDHGL